MDALNSDNVVDVFSLYLKSEYADMKACLLCRKATPDAIGRGKQPMCYSCKMKIVRRERIVIRVA